MNAEAIFLAAIIFFTVVAVWFQLMRAVLGSVADRRIMDGGRRHGGATFWLV